MNSEADFSSNPATTAMLEQINASVQRAREALVERDVYVMELARSRRGSPFASMRVDLSDTGTKEWATLCHAIHYRRDGSAPGGRLDLNINGKLESIHPGSIIKGTFDRFSVVRNSRSSVKGLANLLIVTQEDADFKEPAELVGQVCDPVDLLGASSGTYVTLLTTDPAVIGEAGAFSATGWSRVRVLLSCTAGALTTVTLNPWVWEPTLGAWYAQPTAATPIADTANTGGTKRVLTFDIDCTGLMLFQVSENTSGGTIGAIVQGIR